MKSKESPMLDCLVIGGGPAGLMAATYLKRYRRTIQVVDANDSRAALIPTSHNFPGYTEGIHGKEILRRLRSQAMHYGAPILEDLVVSLDRTASGTFIATMRSGHVVQARFVLMATGVVDIEPELPNLNNAIRRGYLRHCPICDGYEIMDHRVGVIGHGAKGLQEALFIRNYTADLTLMTLGRAIGWSDVEHREAAAAGIQMIDEPVAAVHIEGNKIAAVQFGGGRELLFDTVYSALGTQVRSELAIRLGAETDAPGCLPTDGHQQTNIEGLYAAGDIVRSLDQISVALGQAAIAATAIHNRLPHRFR